jgi:carbamoyl-phosphate synthase large subunit
VTVSLNVLITAGSRRVPLLRAFQRAVQATGGGSVSVADVNPLSPTVYAADRSFPVPLSDAPTYLDVIAEICRAASITLIIPTIDDELTRFAESRERFAALGVRVVVSPAETTTVCNDKHLTSRALHRAGIATVPTYLPDELPLDPVFPLFIKPRFGRGSVGAFPVRCERELAFFLDYVADPVVQPFLDGPEFTIDVLCDFAGEPLSVVPRERVVIRAGVVDRGRTVGDPRLIDLGLSCARALTFVGAVNIQCRIVNGQPIVFEINPRFSGGIPLTIASGADFPRWLVDLARGRRVAPAVGRYQPDLWMSSYETSIFVPEAAVGFATEPVGPPVSEVA